MSANEKDLEIEDDLAKGKNYERNWVLGVILIILCSTKDSTRAQVENLIAIKEEFRVRKGCEIFRFADRIADPEPDGIGRGIS